MKKFNIISYAISIIYGLFTFNYIYNHNEYFEESLPKIMLTGGILFAIFLIITFLVLKYIIKLPKWPKKFSLLSLSSFLSFTIYSLYTIFSNSSSLVIMFSFGIEFVLCALAPALLLYSILLFTTN